MVRGMALRLVDDDHPDPWMRQPTESSAHFDLFVCFRDMGAARSVGRVALEKNKSTAYVGELSRKWDWVARATAYDDEQDRVWLGEVRDARRQAARRHQGMAERMLAVVERQLDAVAEHIEAGGEVYLDPDQMVRWATAAVKIERLAIGAPSEIHDTRSSSIVANAGDPEQTRRIIEDPVARDMALDLLDRMQLPERAGA